MSPPRIPLLNMLNGMGATTWADAEAKFPGCSVAWDVCGGPAWLDGRANMTIVITNTTVSVGCGTEEPYGWAIYLPEHELWLFM